MIRTRVLTVNVPPLLQGVLSGIAVGNPELLMVGDADMEHMLDATASEQPNVVVLGGQGAEVDALLARLRVRYPELRVIALGREGEHAVVHEPDCSPRVIDAVSPVTLLHMLLGRMQ
jgi:chemotaxis response regulator CheB